MVTTTTNWIDQLLASDTHEVKPVERDKAGIRAGQPMLYPSARLIERYIRDIPEGHTRDLKTMRRELAAEYGALATCPVTTRKHLLVIAEAVFEEFDDCVPLHELTPVWRVLDEHAGRMLDRLSFEPTFLFDLRASESAHPADTGKRVA